MNNLLKTISESPLKTTLVDADLKLLLSSVRDVRSQDAKAAESFYGSLEGVLLELRTVTADNHDAEAFLKPVSRMDYPDYYELIKHPMDLGTMMKHVKARKYKSKQEFAADLGLIWKNCFKYNSGPDHVLRGCVTRLKRKADHLLAHVSDRPDRITINGLTTPSAPSSSSSRESPYKPVKTNGLVNGINSRVDHMVATPDPPTPQADLTPNTPGPSNSHSTKSPRSASGRGSPAKPSPAGPSSVPFEEQPALVRTPATMAMFTELDRELQHTLEGVSEEAGMLPMLGFDTKGKGKETLQERLWHLLDEDVELESDESVPEDEKGEKVDTVDGYLKRKRPSGATDQRKRPRLMQSFSSTDTALCTPEQAEEELLDSWWEATRSSTLVVGGLPSLPQFDGIEDRRQKAGKGPCLRPASRKQGERKRSGRKRASIHSRSRKPTKSLLKLMNTNIATLTRVRRTHAKFATLNAAADSANPVIPPPEPATDHEADNSIIEEKGWRIQGEVGQEAAHECLNWMGSKVLQHAGFQGSSTTALSVLTSVTSEYLQNVGRTIRFLCDKYSNTMTSEEIILHTLFEGGTTEIQDLERYIKDDVVRYGGRLGDLEKKLVGAYRDMTTVDVPNDEGMFEDGEEADHFASGLADILGGGEDFLGLRELGIEAEFGLKSLSITKRLWKGKSNAEDHSAPDRVNAGEPPPPFPPPPAFVPLDSSKLDSQIGLLKNFYQERFTALATSSAHPLPPNTAPADPFSLPPLDSAGSFPSSSPKKKGKAKETNGERGNDKDAEGAAAPKKEPKKKKSKEEQKDGTVEADGNPANAEVNGTGPKKKLKVPSSGKKSVSAKPPDTKPPDIPPAIIASA
ncbi:hypothetical protein K439DRAFT_1633690 [Ramaria rubella]|nr:hypothetical protein K439DRAFT_1633690 [Ramaria rubella]